MYNSTMTAQYLAKCAVKSPTRAWGHSGDLTADLALWVGHLTTRFVKSPVLPYPPGHENIMSSQVESHFIVPARMCF